MWTSPCSYEGGLFSQDKKAQVQDWRNPQENSNVFSDWAVTIPFCDDIISMCAAGNKELHGCGPYNDPSSEGRI